MMSPLDLSPGALAFISKSSPVLPVEVLTALGLPAGPEFYAPPPEPGGAGRAPEPGPDRPGPEGEHVRELVGELADCATAHLDGVLRKPEGGRDLAFRLLAADALLTWACEAAAGAVAPKDMLRGVVTALTAPPS